MSGVTSYVICTAPRSGSTLLCMMLAATGVAGNPKSYFHAPSVTRWAEALGVDPDPSSSQIQLLEDVLEAARIKGRAGTDLFGLRVQAHSLSYFLNQLGQLYPGAPNDRARIETAFGPTRYIHLHRTSKLDQAISYVMAAQTGLWHAARDGTEIERTRPPADPVFDAEAIHAAVIQLREYDRIWDEWFARVGVTPVRLDYDRLTSAPRATMRKVLVELDRDPALANILPMPTKKLANATNREWRARFRAETGAP